MNLSRHLAPALITLCLCFAFSCGQKKSILPAAELSFADFTLGQSFDSCYSKAASDTVYDALAKSADGLIDIASFKMHIPDFNNPHQKIRLRGEVLSICDSIYSIKLSSRSYEGGYSLEDMYEAKYGEREKDNSGKKWEFENAIIKYHTAVYTTTRWGNIDIDSTVCYVSYFDKELLNTAQQYIQMEFERKEAAERERQQSRRDKEAAEKAEYERQKDSAQQDIVNNFKY